MSSPLLMIGGLNNQTQKIVFNSGGKMHTISLKIKDNRKVKMKF